MTASIRYVPNRGFKEWLLNAPGTMSEVGRAASAIHSRAAAPWHFGQCRLRQLL